MITETGRLALREFRLSDLDDLAPIMADPRVMEFSISGPWDSNRTKEFLEVCQIDYSEERWGYGRWAVIHRDDERLIGFCGLGRYDEVDGSPEIEIGYRLMPEYWGRGLATEATIASRDYGFEHIGMTRLISMIEPENCASIRVAEKVGMTCEKEIRKWDLQILVYAISRQASPELQPCRNMPS